MYRSLVLVVLFVSIFVAAPSAQAGKVELTTYYPAPYGEYKDVKSTYSLKVPSVASNVKAINNTVAGEIWVEGAAT